MMNGEHIEDVVEYLQHYYGALYTHKGLQSITGRFNGPLSRLNPFLYSLGADLCRAVAQHGTPQEKLDLLRATVRGAQDWGTLKASFGHLQSPHYERSDTDLSL